MSHRSDPSGSRFFLCARAAGIALSAFGWLGAAAIAQETAAPVSNAVRGVAAQRPLADLERAFWACDHAATLHVLDAETAGLCSSASEELKLRKFEGDLHALLSWWEQNKAREHRALDSAFGGAGGR